MNETFRLERSPALHYVGQRRRVPPPSLGSALAQILPATLEHLQARGVRLTSPPLMIYLGHDEVAGVFEIVGGFFVERPLVVESPFVSGTLSAADHAVGLHLGPYDTLGETHGALVAWAQAQGRAPVGPCFDLYVTDPGFEPDPDQWRTEVRWLLAPAESAD